MRPDSLAAGHGVALVGVMRSAFGCLVVLATRWCRAAWVDVDTPPGARRSKAYTMPGRILDLVFSDECVPPASRRAARGAVGRSVAVAVGSVRFGAVCFKCIWFGHFPGQKHLQIKQVKKQLLLLK